MSDVIDHYFTSISPFAWLGQKRLSEIAGRHGKTIRHRPVNLAGVWEISGGVPLPKRPLVRQRYRLIELQRIAAMRGLELNPQPAHFPTNPEPADRAVIAVSQAGGDAGAFFHAVGEALWTQDRQIADETVIAELLVQTGHDADTILNAAGSEETAAIREANTQAAIEADAIGSPAYVYKGEVFWGQDRLEMLESMIASGRPAFQS